MAECTCCNTKGNLPYLLSFLTAADVRDTTTPCAARAFALDSPRAGGRDGGRPAAPRSGDQRVVSDLSGAPPRGRSSRSESGIWQAFVTANWDLAGSRGAVRRLHPEARRARTAPARPGRASSRAARFRIRPEALAKSSDNFEKRLQVDVSDDKKWHALGDPELKCYMPGVPRATYMPFPFQIVQGIESDDPDRVRVHERHAHRPHGLEAGGADRCVDGMVARPVGRRHARRRRHGPARGRGSIAPATFTATSCTSSSATRRRARTT